MKKITPFNTPKKYKIEDCLNQLNHNQYRFARKILPKLIGKCQNTLNNYISIPLDAKEELPYTIGIKLERFFGLEPGELTNEEIITSHHTVLYEQWLSEDQNDSPS